MLPEHAEVLIVGAGPAGLAAAIELKRLGVGDVVVADREPEAGGIPRLCHHIGFGLRDLRLLLSGPDYARRYHRLVQEAGVPVYTNTTLTGWQGPNRLSFTSPQGLGEIEARAVLLATGCRERPRSARLVPGSRPAGVFTTGSLQRFAHEHHLGSAGVGRRAVIVGAELVSLSALMTLTSIKIPVAMMVTELPEPQLYFPYRPMKWLLADLLTRTPVVPRAKVSNIIGYKRVEGIELTHLDSGRIERIDCDTVVFTGDWIPEHETARLGGLEMDPGTRGPQIDGAFHTSKRGVFAAGNLLRGAETADWAALEGRRAAHHIAQFLRGGQWPEHGLSLQVEPPLAWVSPNIVAADSPSSSFLFRAREFRREAQVQVYQGERLLHTQTFRHLIVNESMRFSGEWVKDAQPGGEALSLRVNL
ncbi:MAG: NAD(P)/FAD-dependent oxidoreductase [Chloroflexi bacterium]|nr:NAD(P)/FAD-dependent oxidoreductase [Chloroflexota bacterium]